MIILTPYEYFLLRGALDAYRSDERDGDNELSENFILLYKKLFGVSSYENKEGEDYSPNIVIGPERWDGDPTFYLKMCEDSQTYKGIKKENDRLPIDLQ